MDDSKYGTFFDANTGKPIGSIGEPRSLEMKFDNLTVVEGKDKPKVETVRELRFEFSERHGDDEREINIETFATFKELRKLLKEVTR